MSRTIYVAGASAEADKIASYLSALRGAGWAVTKDWPADVARERAAGVLSDKALPDAKKAQFALEDFEGVRTASMFWLAASEHGTGSWVELGIALGAYRRIVVSGPAQHRSIFAHLAECCFPTHAEALAFLVNQ